MGIKLNALAVAATMVATAGTAPSVQAPQTVGVIAGTITLERQPTPRRSAQRYPLRAQQGEVRRVQQLPAVAYLVGQVPGSPSRTVPPTMAQRDTAFSPPVVHVEVGGGVQFPNGDPFFHNVFSYSSAQRFDLGRYAQGESKDVTFDAPGIVEVFCEVHEFMRGAIIITESPHYAMVDENGAFRIEGVPAGEHTIAFWQQDHEPLERIVAVTSGETVRVEVELRR